MSLDLYTRNISLTQKARFWGNYVSALKGEYIIICDFVYGVCAGNADLCAAPEPRVTHWYPSITETVPPTYPGLRHEFGKLESLQRSQRASTCPPTRVMPDANDRIHTIGYNYCPVHTEIYGSYRNQARRGC